MERNKPMAEQGDSKRLLKVCGLKKHFNASRGFFKKSRQVLKAVDGVSFFVNQGETLGLVGESGCGKSTLGRTILRLYEATEGSVFFSGQNVGQADAHGLRILRKDMQIIFQDPFASLNPRMTVGNIIGEALEIHDLASDVGDKKNKIRELLSLVGLRLEATSRYPHEFSGGQRQRIGIARALAVNPRFIVCDEPISALDVSIQAQIVNLLQDLQEKLGLTYLFIAHDLQVVRHISNRIAVMYLGAIVELGSSSEIYLEPKHPYTRALLSAVPLPDPLKKRNRIVLKGEIPSPMNPPNGCTFHTRCPEAFDLCRHAVPPTVTIGASRLVSCHLYPNDVI